jgi:hypothetical protein
MDKIRTRSHKLAQKTVETLFGTNTKLIMQSCFNKLKDCTLEGRARKLEELKESMVHIGKNTAFKLLQYETAITMANDYCVRRLLPEIAFLTWKGATAVAQATYEADSLKSRVADLESSSESQTLPMPMPLAVVPTDPQFKGRQNQLSNLKVEHGKVSQLDRKPRSIDKSVFAASPSAQNRVSDEYVGDASSTQDEHQTLSQLASFLIPGAVEHFAMKSPLLVIDQMAPKPYLGDMSAQSSSLMDLQQKLNRLESRWASIRLNPS